MATSPKEENLRMSVFFITSPYIVQDSTYHHYTFSFVYK